MLTFLLKYDIISKTKNKNCQSKAKNNAILRKEVCEVPDVPDVPLVKIEEPPSAKAGGKMAGIARALVIKRKVNSI